MLIELKYNGIIIDNSWVSFSAHVAMFVSLQPQTIKINPPDPASGAGQAAQKSACCGS